eukprot:6481684-Amphidinium_carterae.1
MSSTHATTAGGELTTNPRRQPQEEARGLQERSSATLVLTDRPVLLDLLQAELPGGARIHHLSSNHLTSYQHVQRTGVRADLSKHANLCVIDLPFLAVTEGSKKDRRLYRRIQQLLEETCADAHIVILGAEKHPGWKLLHLPSRSTTYDALVAKCRTVPPTHACSRKVTANGRLRVLSNQKMLDHDLSCECDESVYHGLPRDNKHDDVLSLRSAWSKGVLSWFVRVLLQKGTMVKPTGTHEGELIVAATSSTSHVVAAPPTLVLKESVHCSDDNHQNTEVSCPTLAREAWKQRRKQGLPVKKRTKTVEAHYDDCGLDLSGLNDRNQPKSMLWWFAGTVTEGNKSASVNVSFEYLTSSQHKPVVCEICGGEARLSQLLTSNAGWEAGTNYDLMCGIDLSNPAVRDQALYFLGRAKCALVVMSPPCTPFGALGKWNHQLNHDAWTQSAT